MCHLELDQKHSISGCAAFAARVQRGRKLKQVLRKHLGSLWNEGFMNQHSVLFWYRVLRSHDQATVFQAVRYALWLAR